MKNKICGSDKGELLLDALTQGANLGIILLTSSLFILSVTRLQEGLLLITSRFLPLLAGYCLLGVIIKLFHFLPEFNLNWMRGMTAIYWLDAAFFLLTVASRFFPAHIRYMVLTNLAVLIGLWALNYRYLTSVARELNHTPRGKRLVIDLKEKPKSQEEFFRLLEDYCISNHIALTYITRDIPANVELDGVPHRVELNYYYSYGGPTYTMDIIVLSAPHRP